MTTIATTSRHWLDPRLKPWTCATASVNDTTRELGGAFGVAVLGSLLQSTYSARIAGLAEVPAAAREVAQTSLGAALKASGDLAVQNNPVAAKVLGDGAREAYVSGMHLALFVAAVVAVVAAGLVLRYLPGRGEAAAAVMSGAPDRRSSLEPEAA